MTGEHKEIVGVCEKVEVPPSGEGFHKFHVNVGATYPVKLSTKKPELVNAAKNVGDQRAVWGFLESQGNPNPHGGFYMNRYLDSVTLAAPAEQGNIAEESAAPHPAESADAPPPLVDWDSKDLRRHRQAAVAIAVSSFGDKVSGTTLAKILERAEIITDFTYRKVTHGTPEELVAAAGTVDMSEIPF